MRNGSPLAYGRCMTDQLTSTHLLTLRLQVAFDKMLTVGTTGIGRRRIAPILGGTFNGERLRGTVLPGGADWVINRPDGHMAIDVRIALATDDGANIYVTYQGLFRAASPEIMARFNKGAALTPEEYRIRTVVKFETGAERYAWLNDTLAIGVGGQTATGPIYEVFEVL